MQCLGHFVRNITLTSLSPYTRMCYTFMNFKKDQPPLFYSSISSSFLFSTFICSFIYMTELIFSPHRSVLQSIQLESLIFILFFCLPFLFLCVCLFLHLHSVVDCFPVHSQLRPLIFPPLFNFARRSRSYCFPVPSSSNMAE